MSVGEPGGLVPNWDRGPRQRSDIRPHGTEARAQFERRAGQKPCMACLAAENRAHAGRARSRRRQAVGSGDIPPIEPEPEVEL